jgi:hypothetical protein
MKRIVVLLAVVALMVAMSVAPVSAKDKGWACLNPSGEHTVFAQNHQHAKTLEAQGYDCQKIAL